MHIATLCRVAVRANMRVCAAVLALIPCASYSHSLQVPKQKSSGSAVASAIPITTATTLSLTAHGAPISTIQSGHVVTATATVTAGLVPVAPGRVIFCDAAATYCTGVHFLGTAQLNIFGIAILRLTPGIGSYTYKAVFLGTDKALGSSSPIAQLAVSGKYPTTTTIAKAGIPGNYSLTATITGVGLPTASPTGTVSFLDTSNGNAILATASVGAGTYNFSFLNGANLATNGVYPGGIATGDFNGDGRADMALTDAFSNALTVFINNGDGTFKAANIATGYFPVSVVTGDFNADGKTDLAVDQGDDTVMILLGNGDGTFTAAPTVPAGSHEAGIVVDDFNGDGNQDLAVLNSNPNGTVTVLLGNGDGTFYTASTLAAGIFPENAVTGDFNGDGKVDLALTNSGDNNVMLLLGNGDGTFSTVAVKPATGVSPGPLVEGDFNNDGKLDLAVANTGPGGIGNTLTVLLGNGDGSFAVGSTLVTAIGPYALAIGDLNNDGNQDLAVPSAQGATVTVLFGNGDGTFTPEAKAWPVAGSFPRSIVVADFNGDGVQDVATGDAESDTVTLLLTQLTETVTAAANGISPAGAAGLHLAEASYPGDVNYDASLSATTPLLVKATPAVAISCAPNPTTFGNPPTCTVTVSGAATGNVALYYNGNYGTTLILSGGAASVASLPGQPPGSYSIVANYSGDENNNAASGSTVLVIDKASTTVTLALTAGGATAASVPSGSMLTLTATVKAGTFGVFPGAVNFCDAAATYCTDIHLLGTAQLSNAGTAAIKFAPAIGSHSYKAVFIGTKNDAPGSSAVSPLITTGKYPTTTAITASGVPGNYTLTATVVGSPASATSPTGTVSFLDTSTGNAVLGTAAVGPGEANLGFSDSSNPITGSSFSVAAGDFNGDGRVDLAVADAAASRVTILLGNGDGTFAPAASPSTGSGPISIAVGDFNADGKQDLAVANSASDTVTILLGNGDGTFIAAPALTTGSRPYAVVTSDFDGDGNADVAVANSASDTLTIMLGNGDGTFTAAASPITGLTPESLVVGDFNGDGTTDLAVVNAGANTASILLGNGDGTFIAAPDAATGVSPRAIAAADFNADGKLDLAIANSNDTTVTVLLGNGNGTFTAATGPSTGSNNSGSISIGDINGDGIADLALANFNGNIIATLLGNGNGTFTPAVGPPTGSNPSTVLLTDLNGDGKADLAVAYYSATTATVLVSQVTQTTTATVTGIAPTGTGGNHLVDASYPGDTIYAPSVSGTTTLAVPDFVLSAPGLQNIKQGQTVSVALTLTPLAGFSGIINLACATSDSGLACNLDQASVSIASGSTTPASTNMLLETFSTTVTVMGGFLFVLFSLQPSRQTSSPASMSCFSELRNRPGWLPAVLPGGLATLLLAGCGIAHYVQHDGTRLGTHTVTITATSGAITHSQTIKVAVNAP